MRSCFSPRGSIATYQLYGTPALDCSLPDVRSGFDTYPLDGCVQEIRSNF
jgi:hypothetical protein